MSRPRLIGGSLEPGETVYKAQLDLDQDSGSRDPKAVIVADSTAVYLGDRPGSQVEVLENTAYASHDSVSRAAVSQGTVSQGTPAPHDGHVEVLENTLYASQDSVSQGTVVPPGSPGNSGNHGVSSGNPGVVSGNPGVGPDVEVLENTLYGAVEGQSGQSGGQADIGGPDQARHDPQSGISPSQRLSDTTAVSEDPDYPYDSANPVVLAGDSQETPGPSTAASQYELAQPVAGLTDSMPESDVTYNVAYQTLP